MKKVTIFSILLATTFILLADLPLYGGCDRENDREQRDLFGQNRRKIRREKSDRYRAFNIGNYERHEKNNDEEKDQLNEIKSQ